MSLKDDILNTIDDPKAFTNQVSKLVHMPTSVVKSLTEPLGLRAVSYTHLTLPTSG